MYGFIDESGSPGSKINDNDWLVVSIVIFRDKVFRDFAKQKLAELRAELNLPENYEFHRVKNSPVVRKKTAELISKLDFDFITIAIKKNERKSFASYIKIADYLLSELILRYSFLDIELDTNPILFSALKRLTKERGIKAKIREDESRKNDCLQVTDYVVNMVSADLKGSRKSSDPTFRKLVKKELTRVVIR